MKRHLVAGLTLSVAATILLSACGGSSSSASAENAGDPVSGGTLKFAQATEPSCLDPVVYGDMNQATFALQYLDSLVAQNDKGEILPWLATSWDISPDGLVYSLHLREDVKFTDGTPLDAAAVKANFDRILDPATGSVSASSYLDHVASTEVADEFTARVTLKSPESSFLEYLAQSFMGIQSPQAIARGNDENCKSPVGTGPFYVDSYTPGDQAVLKKNPDYNSPSPTTTHTGAAYIDEIDWRFILDASARYAAVTSKQADAADGLTPINQIAAEKDSSLTVQSRDYPGIPPAADLNITRAPFDDVLVRQAFRYASDLQGGLDSIYFGLFEPTGIISPTTPFENESVRNAYSFDIDKANSLLDQAGWTSRDGDGYRTKDGKRLTAHWLFYPTEGTTDYRQFAEQIQSSAKEAGFDIVLDETTGTAFADQSAVGDKDIYREKWTLNTADALRIVYSIEAIDSPGYDRNPASIRDDELDAALNNALLTTDPEERKKLYYQAQQIISDKAYAFGLFPAGVRIVSNNSRVRDIAQDPSLGLVRLYDAWVTP